MASGNDEVLAWCASVFDTFGGYIVTQRNPIDCGFLPRGTHLVNFKSPNYSHGGYLTDNSTTWNASEDYSDNNGGTWYSPNQSFPHSIQDMSYAIAYPSW